VTLSAGGDFACRRHLVRIGKRKAGTAVIKNAICPGSDGVAGCARRGAGGEMGRNVVGDTAAESLRFVPIGRVTAQAISRIQTVIIIDVAGRTGRGSGRRVCANKRETCDAVVEGSGVPALGSVAVGAIRSGKG